MKNSIGRENRTEAMSEELSFETLEQLTGGSDAGDYWKKLVSECRTEKDAFEMLVRDTKQGKTTVGIADYLVGKIEAHYNNPMLQFI